MEFLNDMTLFMEVVKARGFRGAADTIGMPNSTLSDGSVHWRRQLGLRLLHRKTRKIELTGTVLGDRSRFYFVPILLCRNKLQT
ncbi:MAG: hypothetical protein BGO99_13310 [Nitrosospira sp. 56-18]|jgi:DNA-binding transcriptional LysR family regulator|nr:LysR family transcriptional regulator [Nitrosospira sp.]OJY14529.1 MAG: hypothetical protein BGO99_13310 [Nitrosospira sp. 56-18]